MKAISSTPTSVEASALADGMRAKLREQVTLGEDTSDTERTLVRAVSRYTTPEQRIEELDAGGPYANKTESEAARREYNALIELVNSRNLTATRFDPDKSAGLTLATLNSDRDYDVQTLIDCMRNRLKSSQTAIKRPLKAYWPSRPYYPITSLKRPLRASPMRLPQRLGR